jgi:hypothetical protein
MADSRTFGRAAATAALIGATYPLALAAQASIDQLFGDGLLLAELRYGAQRELAGELVAAWLASLAWVAGTWLVLALLRRIARRSYPLLLLVALTALLAGAAAGYVPVMALCLIVAAALLLEATRFFYPRTAWT